MVGGIWVAGNAFFHSFTVFAVLYTLVCLLTFGACTRGLR